MLVFHQLTRMVSRLGTRFLYVLDERVFHGRISAVSVLYVLMNIHNHSPNNTYRLSVLLKATHIIKSTQKGEISLRRKKFINLKVRGKGEQKHRNKMRTEWG